MRKELIERMRDATEGPRMLINEAADMLEADGKAGYHVCVDGVHVPDDVVKKAVFLYMTMDMQPAVPQEPVLYKYEHIYGYLQDQYSPTPWEPTWVEKWLETKLYAAPQPQQPRLTDEEIEDFADASTGYSRMVDIKYFARAIEKKVRGEA